MSVFFLEAWTKAGERILGVRAGGALELQQQVDGEWQPVGAAEQVRAVTLFADGTPVLSFPTVGGSRLRTAGGEVRFEVFLRSFVVLEELPVRFEGRLRSAGGEIECRGWKVQLEAAVHHPRVGSFADFRLSQLAGDLTLAPAQVRWTPADDVTLAPRIAGRIGISGFLEAESFELSVGGREPGRPRRLRLRRPLVNPGKILVQIGEPELASADLLHTLLSPDPDLPHQRHRLAVEFTPEQDGFVRDGWNRQVVAPTLAALRTGKAGDEISFLPCFGDFQEGRWQVEWLVEDRAPDEEGLSAGRFQEVPSLDLPAADHPGKVLLRRLETLQPLDEIEVEAHLPGVLDHDGTPVPLTLRLRPWPAGAADALTQPAALAFGATVTAGAAAAHPVRIGSLDLEIGGSEEKESRVAAALRPMGQACAATENLRPEVSLRLLLPVRSIAPGGQDDPPGEEPAPVHGQPAPLARNERQDEPRRRRPVLVPLSENGGASQGTFRLEATERSDGSVRELTLRLSEPAAAAASRQSRSRQARSRGERPRTGAATAGKPPTLLVLDSQPFLVAGVVVPLLAGETTGEGVLEIANWSGNAAHGASWELRQGEGFTLYLPPQGVGEEMEKGKAGDGYDDIGKDEPADFRFSPPAVASLQPSFFQQRFAEAPWNLRRILGFPGQRAPGAGLLGLRLELLYGLECTIDSDLLRLAELASRLGAPRGGLPPLLPWPATAAQRERFDDFKQGWARHLDRYLSRLAVLEPWHPGRPAERLALSEGVRYRLRGKKGDGEPRPAELRYPIPGEYDRVPADLRSRIPEDGLAGGFAWGFESANVYHAVWREPRSSSGEVRRLYLSALGGWGFQKASFDRDLSSIYADVAMGRTFFYSLERIGRIGVLWNRAKHVIVYDRTVAPSAQFHAQQDPHPGRPLLRKTKEFVELLEPERAYPEFGAPAVTRGAILASRFKSRVIPVDSRWGGDVGEVGWQVPLWRPGLTGDQAEVAQPAEVAEQAEVYPKPVILLEAAADPESGAATVPLEIDEPEKLRFFTDTRDPAVRPSDPDLWPPVRTIDYADLPAPERPAIEPIVAANPDARLPDAAPVEGGLGRFTWALAPAERPVNLVAERSEQPIGARLENVTMMRAEPRPEGQAGDPTPSSPQLVDLRDLSLEALRLPAKVQATTQALLARLPTRGTLSDQVKEQVRAQITRQVGELKARIEPFEEALAKVQAGDLLELAANPTVLCERLTDEVRAALDSLHEQLEEVLTGLQHEMEAYLQVWEEGEQTLKAELKRRLHEGADRVRRMLRLVTGGLGEGGVALAGVKAEVERQRDQGTRLVRQVAAALDQADAALPGVVARAREELARSARTLDAALAALDGKLEALRNERWEKQITAVRDAIADVRKKAQAGIRSADGLLAAAGGSVEEIREALDGAARRLEAAAGEIDGAFAVVVEVLEGAAAVLGRLDAVIAGVDDTVEKAVAAATEEIDGYAPGNDPRAAARDVIRKAVEALRDELKDIDTKIKAQLIPALQEICDEILGSLATALSALQGGFDQLGEDLRKHLDAAGDDLDRLRQALTDRLAALERELAGVAGEVERRVEAAARRVAQGAEAALHQLGSTTLRLLRAFGEPPKAVGIDFNRGRVAFYFDPDLPTVDLTPVTGLVNRVGDELKSLGVRLPTFRLGDRLLPAGLDRYGLSLTLPDFSGLRLDGMFPGVKLPKLANDTVKVTQGVDRQSRRAWVQADVDVPIERPTELFAVGPVTVRLLTCRFRARARLEAGLDGKTRQAAWGRLTGDWEVQVAGTALVRFRRTTLTMEDGRFSFDLSPDKVEMPGALRFLSDLVAKTGAPESGLTVRLLENGGVPAGVEAVLSLPLPDVAAGAFALSDLHLGAAFTLRLEPGPGGLDFSLATRFHIGTRERPFSLAIAILAGGGWLDVGAFYRPRTGELTTTVSVGIVAGAALAFKFGPIKGGVYLFFGIQADYRGTNRRGGSLAVSILLLVRGEAQVFGFISVGIELRLAATYQSGGALVGTGRLSITVKIGRFFKKTVRTRVRYVLAKGKGGRERALPRAAPGAGLRAAEDAPPQPDWQGWSRTYLAMISG